jgi:hypothetical protein
MQSLFLLPIHHRSPAQRVHRRRWRVRSKAARHRRRRGPTAPRGEHPSTSATCPIPSPHPDPHPAALAAVHQQRRQQRVRLALCAAEAARPGAHTSATRPDGARWGRGTAKATKNSRRHGRGHGHEHGHRRHAERFSPPDPRRPRCPRRPCRRLQFPCRPPSVAIIVRGPMVRHGAAARPHESTPFCAVPFVGGTPATRASPVRRHYCKAPMVKRLPARRRGRRACRWGGEGEGERRRCLNRLMGSVIEQKLPHRFLWTYLAVVA